LISSTSELGFSYLFEAQVIGFSTEYRQVAYQKIVGSVQNAVSHKHQQAATVVHELPPNNTDAVTVTKDDSIDETFRSAVLEKYESIERAWNAFDCLSEPTNQVNRADFKGKSHRLCI
jgi:hypothetical protein